jgi:hypothetical protein
MLVQLALDTSDGQRPHQGSFSRPYSSGYSYTDFSAGLRIVLSHGKANLNGSQTGLFDFHRKLLKSFVFIMGIMAISRLAAAQDVGNWQFSDSVIRGASTYSAAIPAQAEISSGRAQDYAPVFSLTCTKGDPLHWKLQVQLEEALSSRGLLYVTQQLDQRDSRDEAWTVTGNKRVFTRFDPPFLRALKTATTLSLAWNWGWTWLWLSDEAKFDLSGVRGVIYTLAKKCEIAEP